MPVTFVLRVNATIANAILKSRYPERPVDMDFKAAFCTSQMHGSRQFSAASALIKQSPKFEKKRI